MSEDPATGEEVAGDAVFPYFLYKSKGTDMTETPLSVSELTKVFRKSFGISSFKAIDSISFEVRKGEILGFLGPNGAGKTTTIKCILGLLSPTSGKARLWGSRPASLSVRRRLGYVPENPDYEDAFSPVEFLSMFAHMRKLPDDRKMHELLLDRVGLKGWESVRIRSFSKGMRQRLSLALALQPVPDLMIMDEPTGGLDPNARKEFRDIILEERDRGASIFLSSHLLSEVETICDRAVILAKGKKVTEGSLDDLLRVEEHYRIEYIDGWKTPEETRNAISVDAGNLQNTIDALRNEDRRIIGIDQEHRTLEDVFLSATGGGRR